MNENVDKIFAKKKKKLKPRLLTDFEIDLAFKNYKPIKIEAIQLNQEIRYKIKRGDEILFRWGGRVINIKNKDKYIVLQNGALKWSVQINDDIQLYCKIDIEKNFNELSERYNKLSASYDELNARYKKLKEIALNMKHMIEQKNSI